MDRIELRRQLEIAGVRADSYSLNGPSEEAYCLDAAAGKWRVYYYERGIETGKLEFVVEAEACDHLLKLLSRDETTRSV